MAPVYGQAGVEFSGLDAVDVWYDGIGTDSERGLFANNSLSLFFGVTSLNRCLSFLHNQ